MSARRPSMLILGTRGIPAAHGGFETFAERLALYLVDRGWDVAVYCQRDTRIVGERFSSTHWRGIEQIHVEVASTGPVSALDFDAHCVRHAADRFRNSYAPRSCANICTGGTHIAAITIQPSATPITPATISTIVNSIMNASE